MKPSGSNKEYITDSIPRLVGNFLINIRVSSRTSQINLSISTFHFIPSAHSAGSLSISKLTTDFALSPSGISANNFRSLLSYFVNLKPPLVCTGERDKMATFSCSLKF